MKGYGPAYARSNGKLCALRSCITSKPRLALFKTSAQVLITRPEEVTIDWLKFRPLRLKAMVDIPNAVNQYYSFANVMDIRGRST